MVRERAVAFRLTAIAVDGVVVIVTLLAATWVRVWLRDVYTLDLFPTEHVLPGADPRQFALLVPFVFPLWIINLHQQRTYDNLRRIRAELLLIRIIRAVGLATLMLLGGLFALGAEGISRLIVLGFAGASVPTLFAARLALMQVVRRHFRDADTWNILLVGGTHAADPLIDAVRQHSEWGIRVLGIVTTDQDKPVEGTPVLGDLDDLPALLEHQPVHQVLMTAGRWGTEVLRKVADSCEELGVRFSMDANFLGLSVARAELDDFDGWHVLTFSSTPANAEALAVKRALDIVVSSILLVLTSPLMLIATILIRLDGGPALFVQDRAGLVGRPFRMLKFRSMVRDAEALRPNLEAHNELQGPAFKMKQDPRITPLGRWLRKTSIDELPQLWNVLRGDMSLVGPRPPMPAEVEKYERWQMRRLSMKPGLTCIWQVSGRSNLDFETWMRLDLEYIDNWSLFLDIKLMVQTVPAVVFGVGAR